MKLFCSFFCYLLFAFFTTNAQQPYWQQQVDYTIAVNLNDATHTLQATADITYTNNSNDTLHYIWFHIWPNAYKNDKTAFSEQLLKNRRTDFYFTADSNKGYIANIQFTANEKPCTIIADSLHEDIIQVMLPQPLLPKKQVQLQTPFTVKLPYVFSRSGHTQQTYQIAQWYPKPAVYDASGWHKMPYLDQGEFYSEFGNYTVHITLPANYLVGATGILETKDEHLFEKHISTIPPTEQQVFLTYNQQKNRKQVAATGVQISSSANTKTITYKAQHVHDFAWFAAKDFLLLQDTTNINNTIVDIKILYKPWQHNAWKYSMQYAKDALQFYSQKIGAYPYKTLTVVSGNEAIGSGGMEYPSITIITTQADGKDLDEVIAHEIGHNWFYGALANNERAMAWMDEGMNSFYETAYMQQKYEINKNKINDAWTKKIPEQEDILLINTLQSIRKMQPIQQPSNRYGNIQYGASVYSGGKLFMQQLQTLVGAATFDTIMQQYYKQWKGKHVQPQNFKQVVQTYTTKNIEPLFAKLTSNNIVDASVKNKKIQPTFFINLNKTDSIQYISALPILGFNSNDKLMLGAAIHNYQLPLPKFKFFIAPMYATGSKQFNLFSNVNYTIYKPKYWLQIGGSASSFTARTFSNTGSNDKLFLRVNKLVPSAKLTLFKADVTNSNITTITVKSFLIQEENLRFTTLPNNTSIASKKPQERYINQLKVDWYNNRILNPFAVNATIEQANNFMRLTATANYHFNYYKGVGGIDVRFFAGKFLYLQEATIINQFTTQRYHLNLTGPSGNEDYTYSDYFVGRNKFEGLGSQQIMQRDGFFKVQTNLLAEEVGRTDNWLMAVNISGDVPAKYNLLNILPIKIPLKYYVDIGTYAEAWNTENNANGRFLYSAGLQLSMLNNALNIYIPVLNSSVFRNYNKSILGDNRFMKTLTFSFNLQQLHANKLIPQIPF